MKLCDPGKVWKCQLSIAVLWFVFAFFCTVILNQGQDWRPSKEDKGSASAAEVSEAFDLLWYRVFVPVIAVVVTAGLPAVIKAAERERFRQASILHILGWVAIAVNLVFCLYLGWALSDAVLWQSYLDRNTMNVTDAPTHLSLPFRVKALTRLNLLLPFVLAWVILMPSVSNAKTNADAQNG